MAKRGIALDIQRFIPGKTTVKFTETFEAEPKPEKEAEPKKSEVKQTTEKKTRPKKEKELET